MKYNKILNEIESKYKSKYQFMPTVDVQSYAVSAKGIIVLDINAWKKPNVFFVFTVLHEIGHCETYKPRQVKSTREFLATQWAISEFNKLGLKLKQSDKDLWQEYIYSFTTEKNYNKYKLNWNDV